MSKSMNLAFFNAFSILSFSTIFCLLLLTQFHVFGMMVVSRNNPSPSKSITLNLDEEYTNLMLLFKYDSAKRSGIEEENLKRRMQFRLIAWNFAHKYGRNAAKRKLLENNIGDMVKFACDLWNKTVYEAVKREAFVAESNPEYVQNIWRKVRKEWANNPWDQNDMIRNQAEDCTRLEFHMDNPDPNSEWPEWVRHFFRTANKLHMEEIKKLLGDTAKKQRNNFKFWWSAYRECMQKRRDEKELKKALELEDEEAKMGRSKAIVPFMDQQRRQKPDVAGSESRFLTELRRLAINSISMKGNDDFKVVKSQIVDMTSAYFMTEMEQFDPILFDYGSIEKRVMHSLYDQLAEDLEEAQLARVEYRLSSALLYGRIRSQLFKQLQASENDKGIEIHKIEIHFQRAFEIAAKFKQFDNDHLSKHEAQQICWQLLQLWRQISSSESEMSEQKEVAMSSGSNYEQRGKQIRDELLWNEHWSWLDFFKNWGTKLLDSNWRPGNVHKFAEFFGGFAQIWAKIHEMEKKGQKPEKFNEDENGGDENFVDKMLTPFRTKLVDFRIIYYIEDYFDQILQLHDSYFLKNIQLMWKAPDQKRSRWALDLLIWLLALDEHFDQIAAANSDDADGDKQKEQLVNHWWNVRVEIEIFHDSMAIRDGGYEGIEKPALNMMNWMYLLKHQKCIQNDNNEKMSKEKNQNEMHLNLLAYIEKCKKLAEKYTNEQRKFFDDDEMRRLRRHYFKQLLAEDGSRFHSVHMVLMFERKLENAYTLKMVEELMGHEVLAEIPNIIKENIHSDQSLMEKWIEILEIANKKVQFQANLDFMYYYANNEMAQTKMFAQKFQTVRLALRREFAKKVYDTTMRIEAAIADALRDANAMRIDQQGNEDIAGNSPFIATYPDENNERTKQIQLVRSIKMINDFTKMIKDGGLANLAFYDTIEMKPFVEVRDNFHDYVEELRNFQMGTLNYRRFAQMLREQGRLQTFLRDTVGAMHAMDTMLGYNEEEKKRNIEAIWESFKGGSTPLDAIGISSSRIGDDGQLNIPARDIDFFNDKRLIENYVLAIQQQNYPHAHSSSSSSSSADVPSPHLLAANIIVFMQNFESTVMRSSNNGQKMQHIRAKYGELIRLLARIEYDKLLTDLESINYEVQREFFALLTAELKNNKFGKKEMIPGIVINYRHENVVFRNKNTKILKNYDNKLGELHSKAMIRFLELEKEGKKLEIKEHGKKGKEQTLAKILQDANSVQKKRRILFNFLGNFENISKVFAKIGSRGMKIRTNDYAQFVEEKMQEEREVEIGEGESEEEYFDALDLELEQEQQKKNVEKHFSSVESSAGKEHAVVDAKIGLKKSWADMADDESELDNIEKEASGSSDTVERGKIQKGGKNAQQEEKMKQIEIVAKETPELVKEREEIIDVQSSVDSGSEVASDSKAKRRRQKKKLAKEAKMIRKEEEAKELKAKKNEEKKQQEEEEFVLLPMNEVDGRKFQGRMIPAFEKYFDDEFLKHHFLSQYEQFVAERHWSPEEHLLITIGTYLNELGKKWKALEQMRAQKMALANTINWELIAESRQILLKWGDNGLRKEREWTVGELRTLMDKLHETLVDVLAEIDGGPFSRNAVGKKSKDDFYKAQMRRQLNWICFARAICAEQRLAAMWSPQDAGSGANPRRAYNREFVALIGTIDGVEIEGTAVMEQQKQQKLNSLERLLDQFEREYLQPFKLMMTQNEIDRELISEYQSNNEASDNVEFHWLAQQFRWSGEQVHQGRAISQQLLSDIDYSDANDEGISSWREGLDVAIERVKHIVTKIWAPQSVLKIGGSYQLGAWTPNSEINAILVASKRVGRERFFGNASGKCESNRWCLDIDSLYCQLCHNKNVFNLVRRPENHIPHLKFIYCTNFARHQMDYPQAKLPAFQCAPFELALASVPGYGTISEKTLQNTWLLIDRFREREEDIYEINWQDARAGMIHALSGYHLNEEILAKLVNKNMLRVFRICLVVLKKWAKNNHIYNGAYGFMNGASLALMLLKTLLRFPISPTVPFILQQFFTQFANWSWPMPVQFAWLGDDKTEAKERKLGWRADRERAQKMKMWRSKVRHIPGGAVFPTLNMPIIAPCKPERNVAYSVNHSTQHIIQGELAKSLELMKKIRMKQKQSQEIEDAKRLWKSLLVDTQPFAKKYTHYLVFYCFAKEDLGDEFCGDYVLYQLRLQLIFSVERNPSAGGILRCHILPPPNEGSGVNKSEQAALNKISKKLPVPSEFRNSLNRYWIIGLEFANEDEAVVSMGKPDFGENFENWLNSSQYGFVEQFKQDYFIFSMRRQLDKTEIHQKMSSQHLFTKFVPADQLNQWVIEETIWLKKQNGKRTADVESGKF